MKKIKTSIVIASFITQVKKEEIATEEIFEYIKQISLKLKQINYSISDIDEQKIREFFKRFSFIGKMSNNKIILNKTNDINKKIEKFFISNLDEELIDVLKRDNRYVFSLINENKLINIHFFSDNKSLNSIKEYFYYDDKKYNSYVIDLEIIKEKLDIREIELFLENILLSHNTIKKEEINYSDLNRLINAIYELRNIENKNTLKYFNILDEISDIESLYETIFKYCYIANKNKINLEKLDKVKIFNKLTK